MTLSRIDIEEISNTGCKTKCNKQERTETTENDLCKGVVSVVDNLPVRCVGKWAVQKIYHLNQYFGIFATGMKNKWQINYIEICSGPGRCISRESGTEFNGTALSIIKHDAFKYVNKALFFDYNTQVVDVLNNRFKALNVTKAQAIHGDYYEPDKICKEIKNVISEKSLNLVLIDPTDCSVPFSLIQHLKMAIPNIDFVINVAIGTDYNRNIRESLLNQDKFKSLVLKYSHFLGSTDFFHDAKNIELAKLNNHLELRKSFREAYGNSLKKIGYEYFRFNQIQNYYDILFASAHPKGVEFWDKANKIKFDGQKTLF